VAEEAAEAHGPLEQFEIHRIVDLEAFGIDVSFTNSALWMLVTIATATLFLMLSTHGRAMVPGRWQSMAEMTYELIASAVRDNVGPEGRRYFPFVFTVFMFVLFSNYLGLLPFAFTFFMAGAIFIGVTLLALWRHKLKFFTFFAPPGVPVFMAPLLIPIEIIGYLTRPVSLSVRLAGNMMAGHIMLEVFAGFVIALGIFGFVPFVLVVMVYALEIIVSFLQAYVFSVLTALYIADAIHLHHE
jgi:F-type H+-transporting ATPase subunit a